MLILTSLENIYYLHRKNDLFLIKYIYLWVCLSTNIKILVKKSIHREQPNQDKKMKTAGSVLLSMFMRDNEKCNISHAP